MNKSNDVIAQIAMSLLIEPNVSLYLASKIEVDQLLIKYLSKGIDYDSCRDSICAIIGSSKPVEWIKDLIDIDPLPISLPSSGTSKLLAWSPYEDKRLISGIHQFGLDNWTPIAIFVGNGRSRVQCRQRWKNSLDPNIIKDKWTQKEDEKLCSLFVKTEKHDYSSTNWKEIASKMNGRTYLQCQYRVKKIQERMAKPKGIVCGSNVTTSHQIMKSQIPDSIIVASACTHAGEMHNVSLNNNYSFFSNSNIIGNTHMFWTSHEIPPLLNNPSNQLLQLNDHTFEKMSLNCYFQPAMKNHNSL